MPMPPTIGHQIKHAKGIGGLFMKACWEIPELVGATTLALIGIGLAAAGLKHYEKTDGDNREFKMTYYIVRDDDPRALRIKNPVFSDFVK